MSSVTNTSQSSARIAVRLAKLQTLNQVLTKGKSDQEISKAFASLKKIDQGGIRKKIYGKEIGHSKSKQKKALISVVKGRIGTLYQSKAGRAFQTNVAKGRIATNPFSTVPAPVQTTGTGSFCAPKDLANFRASFKDAAKIESTSHVIKTYHLDLLIETYLHRSCSDLNESDKTKALHELMSVAYSLSEIEELPKPGYSSLSTFFQEVEARNLIRMMEKIDKAKKLPDFPEGIMGFQVPEDRTETMQKAGRLRGWIHHHQDFLAAINGTLGLDNCFLPLVPKEIGQLQGLKLLYLNNSHLISVPKEIGQLKALQWLHLDNNYLVSIPKEIGQLQALLQLYLGNNCLVRVPKEIGQLKALQGLHLHNNRLVSVPKEIGQLQALKKLFLDDNYLVIVPKEIGQLQALEDLDLDNNGLINLPAELDRFKGDLETQNKQLQLKNILRQLSLCITGQHNTTKIGYLLNTMEKLLGNETRSQIHRCLYEVAQKTAKTDKALRKKLKDKHFARNAFLDENIDPKLKAAAIARFRKRLEKQASTKK